MITLRAAMRHGSVTCAVWTAATVSAIAMSVGILAATPSTAYALSRQERAFSSAGNATLTRQIADCGTYTVQAGDTLGQIATNHGMNWQSLASANGIAAPHLIFPGQTLSLCGSATTTYAAQIAAPVSYAARSSEFCQSDTFAIGPVSSWTVPPSCYSGIYRPNPANYVARENFGWCNWWPEVLHPNNPSILFGARHSQPIPGAVVVFAPGAQGASASGHYGEVVAVLNNGWMLISEMNFYWRGGGFGLVDYRYVQQGNGLSYIY